MLGNNQIHVWRVVLDQPQELVECLRRWLSADEQARASRFHFDRDCASFIVGRGVLRDLLSRYTGIAPGALHLEVGPHGKPRLAGEHGEQLCFNVSHSKGLGLYTVARGCELGIDVECIRAVTDEEQIARRFFSVRENAELLALPVEQRRAAFFTCWTRKEAFIKAIGDGLSHPLDRFDVSLTPHEPAQFLSIGGSVEQALRWSLFSLSPGTNYVGALAIEGRDWQLSCWEWERAHVE